MCAVERAFITVNEFAAARGVDRDTVIRWIKTGVLKAEVWPSGRRFIYRIPRTALTEPQSTWERVARPTDVPVPLRRRRKYRPQILVG